MTVFLMRNIGKQTNKQNLIGIASLSLSCWSKKSKRLPKQYRRLPMVLDCLPELQGKTIMLKIPPISDTGLEGAELVLT